MMLKVLVSAVVLAGLASANCRIGPSYWCASIPQAAQCSALPFCIQAVWTKEKVAKDTDEVCDICKQMVGEARDTLQSNETQEELREVFEGSCDLIPIKVIRKECKVLADEFVPELVETLSSEMNPDTVCTVAGLCNSERIDNMLHDMYYKDGYCTVCRDQMSNAQRMVSTSSDSVMEGMLHELCAGFDSYSDACMYTVSTRLPVIRAMLMAVISPDSCTKSVCYAKDLATISAKDSEDVECEFCTKVVKHWIDTYASEASLQEFKQILDGLCDKLDKKNSAHCKHIVDDYYMPLFEYIKRIDPHMICSAVGICHSSSQVQKATPLATFFATNEIAPLTPLIQAEYVGKQEKSSCLLCEFVMQKVESYLQDQHNADEIKSYLDNLCDDVPTSYQGVCKNFVDEYEPMIIQMIASEIHPSQVCKELKLCSGPPPTPKPPKKSTSCETCRMVAQEIFSVFSDPDDVNMVRNVLDGICYRFPEYIDEPCERFVDKYAAAFLEFVGQGLTPDEVCDALDMCSGQSFEDEMNFNGVVKDQSSDDSACIICEYVVSYLDKMLENKTNEAEIKQALEEVCNYLPASVTKECDQFVEAYTDMVIQLLTGEITPKEMCGYLGLCQNSLLATAPVFPGPVLEFGPVIPDQRVAQQLTAGDHPYCAICEYVIMTVDQMLEDKKNEKDIEVALDRVCYVMPASVKDKCLELINDYTDQIIHLLVNDYPPNQVCGKLSLC